MATSSRKNLAAALRNRNAIRNNGGWQLVELLIALLIAGVVGTSVMKGFAQLLSGTSSINNQILASDIAQQVIDNARNQTYAELLNQVGTHTLVVNDSGTETMDDIFPRALLQDNVNLDYRYLDTTTEAAFYETPAKFGGTVTATITNNNDGTARVNVEVEWSDPGSGRKTYSANTLIAQNGIHN